MLALKHSFWLIYLPFALVDKFELLLQSPMWVFTQNIHGFGFRSRLSYGGNMLRGAVSTLSDKTAHGSRSRKCQQQLFCLSSFSCLSCIASSTTFMSVSAAGRNISAAVLKRLKNNKTTDGCSFFLFLFLIKYSLPAPVGDRQHLQLLNREFKLSNSDP